jgi:DNA-binding NarL/FixJ family response regulator
MPIKILLVDDHIPITDFLEQILQRLQKPVQVVIANSLEIAYHTIFDNHLEPPFELIFLDISMPTYLEKNVNNGEDMAKLIRSVFPTIKIIFITGYYKNNQLDRIIKNINPEGIIDKMDIKIEEFLKAVNSIHEGKSYKSNSILASINKYYENTSCFDTIDLQIINLIKQGITTKNIPDYLPLTISGIHKRKQKIKELLGIELGNDEDIIMECRIRGIFS